MEPRHLGIGPGGCVALRASRPASTVEEFLDPPAGRTGKAAMLKETIPAIEDGRDGRS